jgi:hypothetical protein
MAVGTKEIRKSASSKKLAICIRFSPDQFARINRMAEAKRIPFAGMVRALVLSGMRELQ